MTAYRSVKAQTDSSPWITSIGERVHPHGVAISQDLLKRFGGPLNYGDLIYIEDVGFKIVNDVMNPRHKNRFDIWVATQDKEKEFHRKFKDRKLKIWIIRRDK